MKPPVINGVPMKQLISTEPWWSANGVLLVPHEGDSWKWSVSVNGSEPVANGVAKRRWAACRQIESAIARIREAASKLGT